jgi:hypothetical protein
MNFLFNKQISIKIFLFFLFAQVASSEIKASDTLYYVGNIIISKRLSFNYTLRFTVDSNKRITGYSLSDPGGFNETKAKITGIYDSATQTVNYQETKVLRTKTDTLKSKMCFIHAQLKRKKTNLLETLTGKFDALEDGSGSLCVAGVIKLINTDRYKEIEKQIGNDSSKNSTGKKPPNR